LEFRFLVAVDLLLAVLAAIAIVAAIAASRTAVVAASASGVVRSLRYENPLDLLDKVYRNFL